jgi:hypothetical protein
MSLFNNKRPGLPDAAFYYSFQSRYVDAFAGPSVQLLRRNDNTSFRQMGKIGCTAGLFSYSRRI